MASILPLLFAGIFLGDSGARQGKSPLPCTFPFDAKQARSHQDVWARHLATTVETTNSVGMTTVLIPPGEFQMGSTADQGEYAAKFVKDLLPRVWESELHRLRKEEQPRHRVVLTRLIRVGKTEVTIGQFRKFVEATNYVTETERFGGGNSSKKDESDPKKKSAIWKSPGYKVTDKSPVTQITLGDMFAFCNWLSEKEQRKASYRKTDGDTWQKVADSDGYRLPTEAEWEYACRAGTEGHYSFGDDVAELTKYAWYNKNADSVGAGSVGSKLPNPWGLHDMHGTVWERCQDFHRTDWYAISPEKDPQGPETGGHRIVRGGGWHYFHLHCRSAYRNNYSPYARTGNTGFRVVCPVTSVTRKG